MGFMNEKNKLSQIITNAKKEIPSVDEIIDLTLKELNLKNDIVFNKFGNILVLIDEKASEIYLCHERKALYKFAEEWIKIQKEDIKKELENILAKKNWEDFIKEASKMFTEFGILMQKFEKDLGNMRKARGGITFQKVVLKLLNFIGIRGEMPSGKMGENLGRVDIVIPSSEIALKSPDKAIFLTCKRTLRERWKQETPLVKYNKKIFLVTLDDNISEKKAYEIDKLGFIAFIRDDIKKDKFASLDCIKSLNDLPKEILSHV